MSTETLIVGGFVLLVVVGLVANARNKRRYAEDEEERLREDGASGVELEVIRLQAQQTAAAKQSAGRTGCIMWLLLGLVFGPFVCVILAGLLGLWPILFAGVQ